MSSVKREALQQDVERVTAALRTAIRLRRVPFRHVERELGLGAGYLTRILGGQVQLRVSHVLAVCLVIGLPPGEFFATLFPPEADSGAQQLDPIRLLQKAQTDLARLRTFLEEP
jgi:hypothetical protein